MSKRWIYIIIAVIVFASSTSTICTAQDVKFSSNKYAYVPPTLQNLKAKNEFIKNFQEIKRVRENLFTINMNVYTAKQNSQKLSQEINFYIREFKNIQRNLEEIKTQNSNSKVDVIFAEQLQFTIASYILSLQEQLNLLDLLVNEDIDAANLFYSDYLGHIYYYVTLGDQMVAYVDLYYKLK